MVEDIDATGIALDTQTAHQPWPPSINQKWVK